MKQPSTLNLSVDLDIKRKLFAMATAKGCSISALVTALVNGAKASA